MPTRSQRGPIGFRGDGRQTPVPSVEILGLRAENARLFHIAAVAVRATELLTQALTMGIGDTAAGAKWEQERAVNQVKAIADNIAADLKELGPALSDVVTAAASMAAVQSASGIVMYNTRLEDLEAHLKQAREDIADLKIRLNAIDEILRERGAV
jgi:hypothetical protein